MSGGVQAAVIIPIVVIIMLAIWLVLVYRAARRGGQGGEPEMGNPRAVPRREVAGGAFRSTGGRHVMPRRDETPAEAETAGTGPAETGPAEGGAAEGGAAGSRRGE